MKIGFVWQPLALWIGCHWSPQYKRWCINIVPCLTIVVAGMDGELPRSTKFSLIIPVDFFPSIG